MKQIVFMKQVPASTEVRIDPVTHTLVRAGAKAQTNPDDLHALQLAIELRRQIGGTITAVTMGPPQAEAVLREALMYGADEAVLLTDRAFAGSDTWSTGLILAAAAGKIGPALLLFGKQAIDGDTAQVGPGVAARLGLPLLTEVRRVISISPENIIVEKISDNDIQTLRAPSLCVLTVTKEANILPALTLRAWEEACRKPITRWSASDLSLDPSCIGLNGSPTRVVKTTVPEKSSHIKWLSGVAELSSLLINEEETACHCSQ